MIVVSRPRRDYIGAKMKIIIRRAGGGDLPAIVAMLADDALRFYESLGFEASHEGMKLINLGNGSAVV
jgi:hypothetical protein